MKFLNCMFFVTIVVEETCCLMLDPQHMELLFQYLKRDFCKLVSGSVLMVMPSMEHFHGFIRMIPHQKVYGE